MTADTLRAMVAAAETTHECDDDAPCPYCTAYNDLAWMAPEMAVLLARAAELVDDIRRGDGDGPECDCDWCEWHRDFAALGRGDGQ